MFLGFNVHKYFLVVLVLQMFIHAIKIVVMILVQCSWEEVFLPKNYVLQPDCSTLQSQPCTTLPMLDENNQISYSEYEVREVTSIPPISLRLHHAQSNDG